MSHPLGFADICQAKGGVCALFFVAILAGNITHAQNESGKGSIAGRILHKDGTPEFVLRIPSPVPGFPGFL